MRLWTSWLFVALLSLQASAQQQPSLWFYAPVNFQVEAETQRFIDLLHQGRKAGYQAAVITDYKFGNLRDRPDRYYSNLERVVSEAERLGIELIPLVMQIGYSNSILQNDPNLAAALPVIDCEMVVRNGKAIPANTENLLPGGDFERAERNRPVDWDWIDGFQTLTQLDTATKHSGNASLRMTDFATTTDSGGNCRVVKKVKLKPFHQYQFTAWIKTDQLRADEFRFNPLPVGGDRRSLNYANLGTRPNQDWTRHRIIFNSLDHAEVSIYLGLWQAHSGTVWIDDVELREVAGVNLLRRSGCPIRVRDESGQMVYQEGRDYQRWEDSKLGRVPYLGEYDDDHDPAPLVIADGSRIREGSRLRVSFYHTAIIHDGQVCASLAEDKVFEILETEVALIRKYIRPKRYFMSHDEIRVAGWDALANGRSTGTLLAENARRCTQIIKQLDPAADVMVWSDMFDPFHNARDNYYLTKGSVSDSWKGLQSNVSIVNWNGGKAAESLKFFEERGHRQIIAGFYDQKAQENVDRWAKATRGVQGIDAWMYTTWRKDYSQMEAFATGVRAASSR
ncbi:MAG: hypothetical protein R3C05_21205 [Pirellulaceae bacterium]